MFEKRHHHHHRDRHAHARENRRHDGVNAVPVHVLLLEREAGFPIERGPVAHAAVFARELVFQVLPVLAPVAHPAAGLARLRVLDLALFARLAAARRRNHVGAARPDHVSRVDDQAVHPASHRAVRVATRFPVPLKVHNVVTAGGVSLRIELDRYTVAI